MPRVSPCLCYKMASDYSAAQLSHALLPLQYAQAVSDRDDLEAQLEDVKSELKLEKVRARFYLLVSCFGVVLNIEPAKQSLQSRPVYTRPTHIHYTCKHTHHIAGEEPHAARPGGG
jgi:hypothetical protein